MEITKKFYYDHFEIVRLDSNKWALRKYIRPCFRRDNHKTWWFHGWFHEDRFVFTMNENERKIMSYRDTMKLVKKYIEFLDNSEWF